MSKQERRVAEHKRAIRDMVQAQSLSVMETPRSQALREGRQNESHFDGPEESEINYLKQEIARLEKQLGITQQRDMDSHTGSSQRDTDSHTGSSQRDTDSQEGHQEAVQEMEALKREQAESQQLLDKCRVIKGLLLSINREEKEIRQRRKAMDKERKKRIMIEMDWEQTEETIDRVCKERHELTQLWKANAWHMNKRHQDIEQCLKSLAAVNKEVEQKREEARRLSAALAEIRRKNLETSRKLEDMTRVIDEAKAMLQHRESWFAQLHAECDNLKSAVDHTDTQVSAEMSRLADLKTELHSNKDRLERARLFNAAQEEKLKSETEGLEASWAEQEMKEEQEMMEEQEVDARFDQHQEALNLQVEDLQMLNSEEKLLQAKILDYRSALVHLRRQQRETERALNRKKEAMINQEHQLRLLERKMMELSVGGRSGHVKWAEITTATKEKSRTSQMLRREQQQLQEALHASKQEAQKVASERGDLSRQADDLELVTMEMEVKLSEVRRRKQEFIVEEALLKLIQPKVRDELQTEEAGTISTETLRLLMEETFEDREAELDLQKTVMQAWLMQTTEGCQEISAGVSKRVLEAQKLMEKYEDVGRSVVFLDGVETSLLEAQAKKQTDKLSLAEEGLVMKSAAKEQEAEALEDVLSMAGSSDEAFKANECEVKRALGRELYALLKRNAQKSTQIGELEKDIKGMNVSLDELIHEERDDLMKLSQILDLCSEVYTQDEELKQLFKNCYEIIAAIWPGKANDSLSEDEEDIDQDEEQGFSPMEYPELHFLETGQTPPLPFGMDSECSENSCSECGYSSSGTLVSEADWSELPPQDTMPATRLRGIISLMTNQQQGSGQSSTDACWGSWTTSTTGEEGSWSAYNSGSSDMSSQS